MICPQCQKSMRVAATWKLPDRVVRRRVCECGLAQRSVELWPAVQAHTPLLKALDAIEAHIKTLDDHLDVQMSTKLPWKGNDWKEMSDG